MKAILLSIKPEHALNILNGRKTLELRKSVPKDFVGWVYMYVTKRKPYLYMNDTLMQTNTRFYLDEVLNNDDDIQYLLNGSIVARFWFDGFNIVKQSRNVYNELLNDVSVYDKYGWVNDKNIFNKLQLSKEQIISYGNGKDLYAWHISKLEIFDEPMELGEFGLKRPSQSWQYVWVKEELK